MWKNSLAGVAVVLLGAACADSGAGAEDCAAYHAVTVQQQTAFGVYCAGQAQDQDDSLFPEFFWCMQQKPPIDCATPEVSWCETVGKSKAQNLRERRASRISACKAVYEQAFNQVADDWKTLIPGGQVPLMANDSDDRLAPIEHDYNGDGKADWVFVTGQSVEGAVPGQNLRLMVAVSQPDGRLKSMPVAPLWLSNMETGYGYPQSSIRQYEEDGLRIKTFALDHNNWDNNSEYLFRFRDGRFVLVWQSSGYTEISYDGGEERKESSTVIDYDKGIRRHTDQGRCDEFGAEAECPGGVEETLPADQAVLTIANFLELSE